MENILLGQKSASPFKEKSFGTINQTLKSYIENIYLFTIEELFQIKDFMKIFSEKNSLNKNIFTNLMLQEL